MKKKRNVEQCVDRKGVEVGGGFAQQRKGAPKLGQHGPETECT